jgi:hypothetical protein
MVSTIILICLLSVRFFYHTFRHKETMKGEYNSFHALFTSVIYLVLYYYAGLFDKF